MNCPRCAAALPPGAAACGICGMVIGGQGGSPGSPGGAPGYSGGVGVSGGGGYPGQPGMPQPQMGVPGYSGAPGVGYPGQPGMGYPGQPGMGYPGQPGMGYPGFGAPSNPHDTPSLVLGLLVLLLGPLSGVPALIIGLKGRRWAREQGGGGGGSLFGIIAGVVSILGAVLVAGLIALSFATGDAQEIGREIEFELRVEDEIAAMDSLLEGTTVTCDEVPEVLEEGDVVRCTAEVPLLDGSSEETPVEVEILSDDELGIEFTDLDSLER